MVQTSNQILTNKKILLISPDFWGINFVSKHHYAQALSARNNTVFYLNPPTRHNNLTKINSNLYVVDYRPLFRGIHRLPSIISGKIIQKELKKIESLIDVNLDIIWNFDTSRFFNLSTANNKLRIAHIVDWSEDFNREILCKTSDLCLCTSDFLKKKMTISNPRSINLGHGYAPSDYKLNISEEKEIIDTYKIKVGYVGNLNLRYLDWAIINTLIIKNPSLGFFFIGPEGESNLSKRSMSASYIKKLKAYNNTFFLGEKSAKKIPGYLMKFDILILVYKSQLYRKQLANPHKLLEYLGSGKVILSSWTEAYKNKQDLIEMVKDNKDFLRKFNEIVKKLPFYNSVEQEAKRIKYAMENTYDNKIQLIEQLISKLY